ncbi:hypothetical protein GCK32_007468 [Trichostrongylus colubriformis]|uniref:Mos1 transposase HTH domain-containing protein n=1 Tax=Trichostrongylus colubriformis TaxID=6319 RepID=A0AAN8J2U9_TRICO
MFLDMQIRICVLYEFKLNRHVPVAFENLSRAFGDGAISRESVYRWYHRFRRGNETLEDERGPFSIIDDDELKKCVEENPTLSLRELAKRFGVGRTAIRYHLDKIANGKRVRYDAKKAEDAKKRKQGIPVEDDEKKSTSETASPSLDAPMKTENGSAPTAIRIFESQKEMKQEISRLSQGANDVRQLEQVANNLTKSQEKQSVDNLIKNDVDQQKIRFSSMPPLDRQVRVCILYEFKLGNVANLAFLNVNRAFGEGTVSNAVVHRWFARFQEGDEDLDSEPTKEFDIDDETIEEDPAVVEALLSKQYGVPPGTLYTHLDRMGRGERLHELEPEELGLTRASEPPRSMRGHVENGTVPPMPSTSSSSAENDIKLGVPEDCKDDVMVKDVIKVEQSEVGKLHSPGSSTQNGHSVEYNKVRICDNGLEYRNTLGSTTASKVGVSMDPHPSVEARKIPPRSGGVIARSLACLAKYRAENQQSDKTPLYEVKPPPMDEASDVSTGKEVKAETVELPTEGSEMKEHIVPLF